MDKHRPRRRRHDGANMNLPDWRGARGMGWLALLIVALSACVGGGSHDTAWPESAGRTSATQPAEPVMPVAYCVGRYLLSSDVALDIVASASQFDGGALRSRQESALDYQRRVGPIARQSGVRVVGKLLKRSQRFTAAEPVLSLTRGKAMFLLTGYLHRDELTFSYEKWTPAGAQVATASRIEEILRALHPMVTPHMVPDDAGFCAERGLIAVPAQADLQESSALDALFEAAGQRYALRLTINPVRDEKFDDFDLTRQRELLTARLGGSEYDVLAGVTGRNGQLAFFESAGKSSVLRVQLPAASKMVLEWYLATAPNQHHDALRAAIHLSIWPADDRLTDAQGTARLQALLRAYPLRYPFMLARRSGGADRLGQVAMPAAQGGAGAVVNGQ